MMAVRLAQLGSVLLFPLLCSSSATSEVCANAEWEEADDDVAFLQGGLRTIRDLTHPRLTDPFPDDNETNMSASDDEEEEEEPSTESDSEPFCNLHKKTFAAIFNDGVFSPRQFRGLKRNLEVGGVEVKDLTTRRAGPPGTLEERLTEEVCTKHLGLLFLLLDHLELCNADLEYIKKLAHQGTTVVFVPNYIDANVQAAKVLFDLDITVRFIRRRRCRPRIFPAPDAENCFETKRIVKGWDELPTRQYVKKAHGKLCKLVKILTTNDDEATVDLIRPFGTGKVILGDGILISLLGLRRCPARNPDQRQVVQNLWEDAACH